MSRILLFAQDPRNWIDRHQLNRTNYDSIYNNTGNLVWCYGISKVLHHPQNTITYNSPLTKEHAIAANRTFDHVVFSFANVISKRQLWRLERLEEFLSHLTLPVTVCSIGIQAVKNDDPLLRGIEPTVKRILGLLVDRGGNLGVRGHFTAEYLEKLGFAHHIRIIGCPSFYMAGPALGTAPRSNWHENGVAVVNDSPATRATLFSCVERIFHGREIYITQEYIGEDVPLDYEELLLLARGRLHQFTRFHEWRHFMHKHQLSLSSRIHGSVVALHAQIPTLLYAWDRRTEELGRHIGLSIVTKRDLLKARTPDDLLALIDSERLAITYRRRYSEFLRFLDDNNLPHWQSPGEHDPNTYYDREILALSEDTECGDSLVQFGHTHAINRHRNWTLGRAMAETYWQRTWTSMKGVAKAALHH